MISVLTPVILPDTIYESVIYKHIRGNKMEEKHKKIEELNGFKDMRIVDNFYQTSSFFPMPTPAKRFKGKKRMTFTKSNVRR